MNQYRYSVDDDSTFESAHRLNLNGGGSSISYLATEAAEDYYSNNAGYLDEWPVSIEIFKEDGSSIGVFNVECERTQYFRAERMDK